MMPEHLYAANEYKANMDNFIPDIRAEFGKPSLPFSIDTTHWKNNSESMWLIGKGMGNGMVGLPG